jgi:hypothetical protein
MSDAVLSALEVTETVDSIVEWQLPNGMIPWFPGGHADPWNHVEAAMAMLVGGRQAEAERAFDWLAATQHGDGSWCMYYLAKGVEEPRRDPNVCAYVATGVWWHHLITGDLGLVSEMWPVVDAAIGFSLGLQEPGGEVLWSRDPDGTPGRYALLTGSCSIHHSLRCAVAMAEALGHERPEWELAAGRLAHAVAHRPDSFEPKDRWAMDWYYPVLSGILGGATGLSRMEERWDEFVIEGVGVRCVSDRPWVTAAETAECVIALDALGDDERARTLLGWSRHLRDYDGSYWTGCVHPECVRFPGGERTTYTAAAVVLASHVLAGGGAAAGLFRGAGIPEVLDLGEVGEPIGES